METDVEWHIMRDRNQRQVAFYAIICIRNDCPNGVLRLGWVPFVSNSISMGHQFSKNNHKNF